MNRNSKLKTLMKTGSVLAMLAGCLSSSTVLAQSIVLSANPSQGGANYVPPTAAQMAVLNRIGQFDHAAAVNLDAGRFVQAENDARAALLLGQDSGVARELLASALDAQGKSQQALQVYQQMVDQGNDQPRVLLPYALLQLKNRQWAAAVHAYNKALPHLAYGELMRAKGEFPTETANSKTLETAIHIALGLTYYGGCSWGGASQDDKALNEYQKALQLSPESDIANYYYSSGLQRVGRQAEAQAAFALTAKMAHGSLQTVAGDEMKQ